MVTGALDRILMVMRQKGFAILDSSAKLSLHSYTEKERERGCLCCFQLRRVRRHGGTIGTYVNYVGSVTIQYICQLRSVMINTTLLLHFRRDVPFDQSETQQ
jgi:hypothetical protein